MTYSYYTPIILYGFQEELDQHLDPIYIQEKYGSDIYTAASEINRGFSCGNIIGIKANISPTNGNASYDEEAYNSLIKIKTDYEKHHGTTVILCYLNAIQGDYIIDGPYYRFHNDLDDTY